MSEASQTSVWRRFRSTVGWALLAALLYSLAYYLVGLGVVFGIGAATDSALVSDVALCAASFLLGFGLIRLLVSWGQGPRRVVWLAVAATALAEAIRWALIWVGRSNGSVAVSMMVPPLFAIAGAWFGQIRLGASHRTSAST